MCLAPPGLINKIVSAGVLVSALVAATLDAAGERLPVKTYTTADGLPRDQISRNFQDSKGFLWFSTSEGLSRFDGYKFTTYGTEQGLAGRQVNDFLETRSGTYWAATDKGLCRFNPDPLPLNARGDGRDSSQRFVVYYPGDKATARYIEVIYEDHAGTIWCGTYGGLFRLDQTDGQRVFSFVDIIQPVGMDNSLLVRAIIEDRQGALWIGAESGLYKLRSDGVVERFSTEEGLPKPESVRVLLEDREGRLWVGTAFGLCQLVRDPKPHSSVVARVYTTRDGLPHNIITSLYQSSDGKLWVGTGLGLSEFLPAKNKDGGRFHSYTSANGLGGEGVTTLAEDRDGNLWVGTYSGGAMRLAASGFTSYSQADGLGGISIASIFEDLAGELCVINAGNAFINRFDGRGFISAPLALPKGISNWGWGWNQIMFQDSRKEWWMNTAEGLVRYSKLSSIAQTTHARPKAIYTTSNGLPSSNIFRLFEDSHGDIWISTMGNPEGVLTRWERATETFHPYTTADGIHNESAPTAFCEDGAGDLWIGFYLGGLVRYSAGRFTQFNNADGVPPGFIRGLYLDHEGRLWVATAEGGIARTDNPNAEHPTFVTYSAAEGLSSNQATCVTEDQMGAIYVGTGRGVDKLDPATGHIKHYSTSDGLANNFINVGFRHRDGSLWFGTLQGLSRLIPQPERPPLPAPILISGMRIAGITYPISELGELALDVPEISASRNQIQIEFVGLAMGAGELLRYQYKLEGAEKNWSAPTDQRAVNYPNLPPASYRFLVRAVSADGTISTSPAVVSFRILPPIWRRWWFITIAALLIGLAIYAADRYRVARLLELERVRTRIATDLHDDIGASLSRMAILSEVVKQQTALSDHRSAGMLTEIADSARGLVDSMSDIVWSIDPRMDDLNNVVMRVRAFASEALEARGIRWNLDAPLGLASIKLSPDQRRHLYLIFKEAINNIARHSNCANANLKLNIIDGELSAEIEDDGLGLTRLSADAGPGLGGNGLRNMGARATELGGELTFDSSPGSGTRLRLAVPLKRRR